MSGPRTPVSPKHNGLIRRTAALCGIMLWSYEHHRPKPKLWSEDEYRSGDTRDLPSIAIVTPTYKHVNFIRGAVESVVSQHYPNLQYAVCDGGSSDGTRAILEELSDHLTRWTSTPDKGQGDAINRGFAMLDQSGTPSEIMGWLNADDRHLPWTLHTVGRYFRDHPEVDAIYGDRIIGNSQDKVVGRWILPKHRSSAMLWRDYVPQETLFWRRRLWDRVGGGIDTSLDFAIDWDLLLRFHDADAVMHHLPLFLGVFTTHEQQKSATNKETVGRQEFAQLRSRWCAHTGHPLRGVLLRSGSACYILRAALLEWHRRLNELNSQQR